MEIYPLITPPEPQEYATYYGSYVTLVPSKDLIGYFRAQAESVTSLASDLEEEELLHRYAPEKWSIKEVFSHIIDTERIFCYRALCFARNDATELPGFEENDYAKTSQADARNILDILEEYAGVRQATISLFKSFDEEMLNRIGIASKNNLSVRAAGYIIAGHELHHLNVIKERYLA